MKKSLLAMAVAGAVAAPISSISSLHAAEYSISGTANINLMVAEEQTTGTKYKKEDGEYKKDDKGNYVQEDTAETEVQKNGLNVDENDLQVNFAVTDDVGFGEAFANMRLDLDILSGGTPSADSMSADSMRVGLRGDFGSVTLGEGTDYAESGQKAGDILKGNPNTPNAALSYELPTLAPGLTVGVNLIYDRAAKDDGQMLTSGTAFGVNYSHDMGDSGSLSVGVGQSNVSKVTEMNDTTDDTGNVTGKLKEDSNETQNYQSIGVSYAIAGISIGVAQQTENKETEEKKRTDETIKTEYEPSVTTDIKVGYSSGPISFAVTQSSGKGYATIRGYTQEKDKGEAKHGDQSSTATRIDVAYALSDSTTLSLRNQTKSDEVDADNNKDSSASFTRLTLGVNF